MGFEALREDETSFYGLNKVATPARVFVLAPIGGKKQPTLEKDYLADTGVGKRVDQRDPLLDAYNPNKYNIGS